MRKVTTQPPTTSERAATTSSRTTNASGARSKPQARGRTSSPTAATANTDPRIDAYIAKAQPFAQPILVHLRAIIHAGCPSVTETIKWGMPAFEYKGPLCGMAAFKAHATFGFWKASLVAEKHPDFAKPLKDSMGQLGRITAVSDLPPKKTMIQWVKDAAAINDQGLTVARPKRGPVKQVETPDFLLAAFKKNKAARLGFESLSPSHQREYIEWLTSAKQEATRARRLATALEWMVEGKSQNWRYERKR